MSTTEPTSLRVYFAANAPAEIPDWFKPAMDHLQPLPKPVMSQELQAKADAGSMFGGLTTPDGVPFEFLHNSDDPDVQQYMAEVQAWRAQNGQVEQRQTQYRYFAWRWYYADQMIEASRVLKQERDGLFSL